MRSTAQISLQCCNPPTWCFHKSILKRISIDDLACVSIKMSWRYYNTGTWDLWELESVFLVHSHSYLSLWNLWLLSFLILCFVSSLLCSQIIFLPFSGSCIFSLFCAHRFCFPFRLQVSEDSIGVFNAVSFRNKTIPNIYWVHSSDCQGNRERKPDNVCSFRKCILVYCIQGT